MKDEIERALAPLTGLAVWGPGRESNMLALQLGVPRPAPTRADPGRAVGAYALHVYCAWRLVRGATILAASGDLFTPADPSEELESFDFDEPGATWWDVRLAAHFSGPDGPAVASVAADAFGGMRLALADGSALEVFPNSSRAEEFETEFWRLRRPGSAEPDMVVGTFGIDRVHES